MVINQTVAEIWRFIILFSKFWSFVIVDFVLYAFELHMNVQNLVRIDGAISIMLQHYTVYGFACVIYHHTELLLKTFSCIHFIYLFKNYRKLFHKTWQLTTQHMNRTDNGDWLSIYSGPSKEEKIKKKEWKKKTIHACARVVVYNIHKLKQNILKYTKLTNRLTITNCIAEWCRNSHNQYGTLECCQGWENDSRW